MQTALEVQLKKEQLKEDTKRIFIDKVCETVRSYAEKFLREDRSNPPKPMTVRLKQGVKEDEMNTETVTQIILHVLDHTANAIEILLNTPQESFHDYLFQMHDAIEQELDELFVENKKMRTISNEPNASEYKAIYRTFDGMDEHYENLLKAGAITEPLERKHLDAIAAMHNRRKIRSKRAYSLAKKRGDDKDTEEARQVFVEDFDVDRKVIDDGLLNAETMEMHNLPITVGSVVRHPDGTLLGFAILLVFRENCTDKRILLSHIERGYSGGGLQYHGKKKGKKKREEMLRAAQEGKPFVILLEVGGEAKRAARMAKSAAYLRLRDEKILKDDDFIGLAYWARGLVMEWIDAQGEVKGLFEGIEDPPGKNDGGEEITRKFAMGKAGSFGNDFTMENKKKRKEFPADDGGVLRITTEWANVSGTGENIMEAAEKQKPPVIFPDDEAAASG